MMSALRPVASKVVTSVTALALAFGVMAASAAPARAQMNSDAAKVIAGIAALAVIGAAINDKNDRRDADRRRHDQWDRHDRPRYQPPPRAQHFRPGPPPRAHAHGWQKHPQHPPQRHGQMRPRPGEPRPRF